MRLFDVSKIVNLVSELGGDHQQASQHLSSALGPGEQVDSQRHGNLLEQLDLNPQLLHEGRYGEHLDDRSANYYQKRGDERSEPGYDGTHADSVDSLQDDEEGRRPPRIGWL